MLQKTSWIWWKDFSGKLVEVLEQFLLIPHHCLLYKFTLSIGGKSKISLTLLSRLKFLYINFLLTNSSILEHFYFLKINISFNLYNNPIYREGCDTEDFSNLPQLTQLAGSRGGPPETILYHFILCYTILPLMGKNMKKGESLTIANIHYS